MNTPNFSLFKGGIIAKVPERIITLKDFIDIIQSDTYKNQIIEIRDCKDKEQQRLLKNKLDFCIPSGTFITRDVNVLLKDKMKRASGILSLDVDDYDGDYTKLKATIKADEYTAAIFDSPRGMLKIFVYVPPELDNDLFWRRWVAACKFFGKRWDCEFDELKDITRACFVSYDPSAYYNGDAKVFKEIADKEVFQQRIKPVDYSILTKGIEKGNRNEAMFSLGCSLMHKNVEPSYVEEMLKVINKKNNPPLTDTELQQIFKNVFKYKKKEEVIDLNNSEQYDDKTDEIGNLPNIQLPQENKTLVSNFIENISGLLKDKDLFYRVGDNSIIEIIDGSMRIVTPSRLVSLIESVCIPIVKKWNLYKQTWESHKKSTGEQVCKIVLVAPLFYNKLKRIEKILSVPIPILKDGKILFPEKEYNPDLKLWLNPDTPKLTEPDMKLETAKEIFSGLFRECCFKGNDDEEKKIEEGKSLLALLTPYVRGLYDEWNSRTPVFIYFGNREGTGKDYLALMRIIVFGEEAIEEPPISTGKKDGGSNDELRKKFLTGLMYGKCFFHFANNKGHINNSVFEGFITARVWSDRILGKNDIATFQNTTEISLSANTGTTMTADLGRRGVVINLFLAEEKINKRKFNKPNLHNEIVRDRGLILSALYSLVRNWVDKGKSSGTELFTSFPEWARICGGILEAAEYENPLKNAEVEEIGLDSETEDMKTLFEYMWEEKPDVWVSKKEIKEMIINDDDLNVYGYLKLEENSGAVSFGLLLNKFDGRILSDIEMKTDTSVKRVARRKIMFSCKVGNKKPQKEEKIPEEEVKDE